MNRHRNHEAITRASPRGAAPAVSVCRVCPRRLTQLSRSSRCPLRSVPSTAAAFRRRPLSHAGDRRARTRPAGRPGWHRNRRAGSRRRRSTSSRQAPDSLFPEQSATAATTSSTTRSSLTYQTSGEIKAKTHPDPPRPRSALRSFSLDLEGLHVDSVKRQRTHG